MVLINDIHNLQDILYSLINLSFTDGGIHGVFNRSRYCADHIVVLLSIHAEKRDQLITVQGDIVQQTDGIVDFFV